MVPGSYVMVVNVSLKNTEISYSKGPNVIFLHQEKMLRIQFQLNKEDSINLSTAALIYSIRGFEPYSKVCNDSLSVIILDKKIHVF